MIWGLQGGYRAVKLGQRNTSNMAEILSKRLSNFPKRYSIYETEGAVSLSRPSRKSGGKRSQNNNGGEIRNMSRGSEGNESDSDDYSQSDHNEQSKLNNSANETMENNMNECEESIENNTNIIQYVSENVSVVLKVLMSVLPLATVQQFTNKVQDVEFTQLIGGEVDSDLSYHLSVLGGLQ